MKNILDSIKNPPQEYRPVPFWSWNSKLETEETKWQVNQMDSVGMGGFFMHARGGLKTEYMGEEWLENVKAAVLEGDKLGMQPWGYDENGWPSGFGSDAVNGLGIEYQQKYLRCELCDEQKSTDRTITNIKLDSGKFAHMYYDVNPFYVDTLDGKVTDEFIKSTHEKYKAYLGEDFSKMKGFFTDEPQISRAGIPWSFILEEEYKKAYGTSLTERLYDLFSDKAEANETRFKFWKLVTRLFTENFLGRIYDWCEKNGSHLTGHMVCEETINSQLESNGSVMPNYEYFHIPGVDKLGRSVDRLLLLPQITSVCAQLGKKQILSETFALCGWDVSFEELKWIYEWQMVKGVNLLCQHLAGYSLAGIRKRDYPAGHFYQNPWWNDYNDFNDFASRMGMLLAEGEIKCDVLVLHTISTGWINHYGEDKAQKHAKYTNSITDITTVLDKNQILFHLGDDLIMHRHAKVEKDKLVIGNMSYSTVIVPSCTVIDSETLEFITEFQNNGGKLIFVGEVPSLVDGAKNDAAKRICKNHVESASEVLSVLTCKAKVCSIVRQSDGTPCDIQVAYRAFEGFEMYYLVNTFADKEDAVITLPGKSVCEFDYLTGETKQICFEDSDGCVVINRTIEKMGSVVYFVKMDDTYKSAEKIDKKLVSINDKLHGDWFIKDSDQNVLTLDYCDCYFNGELYQSKMHIGDVQQPACDYKKKVKVALDFDVNLDRNITGEMYLVVEEPQNYTVYVNGKVVEKKDCGYYRDKSFRKLDISGLLEKGYNIITLECDFVQSQEVYDTLDNCTQFESVKNKLYYDMEIEAVYLVGDFGVECDGEFVPAENNSYNNDGKFSLTVKPVKVTDGDLVLQKFPFFCGSMKLTKTINLTKDELEGRFIEFASRNSTITKVTVNGKSLSPIYWAPYICDLDGVLVEGENVIDIEIIGNFRNMLGPHHLGKEEYSVSPGSFIKTSRVWKSWSHIKWYDSYNFVKFGLFLK